ncbi:hypothetical protein FRB99_006576 [Tulasnella sp. 403]|nr:hypothetical protein FRB99_006576 [Tulasnella sp. 403]
MSNSDFEFESKIINNVLQESKSNPQGPLYTRDPNILTKVEWVQSQEKNYMLCYKEEPHTSNTQAEKQGPEKASTQSRGKEMRAKESEGGERAPPVK